MAYCDFCCRTMTPSEYALDLYVCRGCGITSQDALHGEDRRRYTGHVGLLDPQQNLLDKVEGLLMENALLKKRLRDGS